MDNRTKEQLAKRKGQFVNIQSVRSLCELIRIDQRKLKLITSQPRYKTFTIPKRNGGQRTIETPDDNLKRLLGNLNKYLQATYFFEKSNAAYGFITGVKNDNDRRNIVTNARKHKGRDYMINIDLKDFFHQVSKAKVAEIFTGKPFNFKPEIVDLLTQLTTYKDRLPMGIPTSPVLSNFACRTLDTDLIGLAASKDWVYTRYADDLTFSAKQAFSTDEVNQIRRIIKGADFEINERKVKLFDKEDLKVVTGLIVGDNKVTLTPDYMELLKKEITTLAEVMKAQNEQGTLQSRWSEKLKQQVQGRLSFAGFVLRRSKEYQDLKDEFYTAINPPEENFGAVSWRSFPYNF